MEAAGHAQPLAVWVLMACSDCSFGIAPVTHLLNWECINLFCWGCVWQRRKMPGSLFSYLWYLPPRPELAKSYCDIVLSKLSIVLNCGSIKTIIHGIWHLSEFNVCVHIKLKLYHFHLPWPECLYAPKESTPRGLSPQLRPTSLLVP